MRHRSFFAPIVLLSALLSPACTHQEVKIEEAPFQMEVDLPSAASEQDVLPEVWRAYEGGNIFSADALLRAFLEQQPTCLEAGVLLAHMEEEGGAAEEAEAAWQDVEALLVYHGKLRPFLLTPTLFAAARRYLRAGNNDRAKLFLDELWRMYPASEWSQLAMLEVAETAVDRGQWVRAAGVCSDLLRMGGSALSMDRCGALVRIAERMLERGPEAGPGAPAWSWVHPLPQGNDLNDLWSTADGELFAVGERGTLLHRPPGKDTEFTPMPALSRWNLYAIHGSARDNIFAVGAAGLVIHFDGKSWSVARAADALQADLLGVYTAGPGHVAAVAASGEVLELFQGKWSLARPTNQPLHAIWGTGRQQMLAVGKGGLLLVLREGTWTPMTSDSYEDLWAIWGSAADRVFAAGQNKTVVFFNGKETKESVAGSTGYRGLWGFGNKDLWAAGDRGSIIYRLRDLDWKAQPTGVEVDLSGVAGGSPRGMFAVGKGGTLLALRAGRWRRLAGGDGEVLVGLGPGLKGAHAMALGEGGTLLVSDAKGWRRETMPQQGVYTALWSNGATAAAVGRRGLMMTWDGQAWKKVVTNTAEDLLDVKLVDGGGVVAVGTRGTVVRVAGGRVSRDLPPTGLDLHGVWALSPRDMLAVGRRGVALHFNGAGWHEEETGELQDLHATWCSKKEYVVVGKGGAILHRQDGRWHSDPSPTSQTLVSVWGDGKGKLFAASQEGGIIRNEGQDWSVDHSPANCLRAVHGTRDMGVLAVGCNLGIVGLK